MPAKVPSLYRSRHGVFYLRVCLPEAERRNPKSKEVWRSLRTKDAKIAKGLALRFAIEKNYAMPDKSPKTIADEITNPLSFTSRDGHTIAVADRVVLGKPNTANAGRNVNAKTRL